ncbi:V/A-type H+-transporting ATPase subunit C [Haloplanus vescus]|uniref:A-type ATP synthase subunit C n=1 Tax=Haloplanus vescus TaxID=555874 RepID=A0A1H3XCC8_9EURY|nr:V-type ATP synthase subunit C [Haloplanus vescus]SDZ96198.1 V/A-type H+-transporting ATPase subunit C [Haloplanus vescus]
MSASSGSSNPEYVTARVRSRRAALFSDDDYRKLVRMGPSEIARFMEESEYEREINALGSRHSGVDLIEYALNRNLAKHFNDLLDWADGRLYDHIARYLRKFDAWNVKTILRGIYADAERDDVDTDLIRAGELSDRQLDRLLDAATMEDVIELLDGTMFAEPLEAAYEDYEETGVLVPLENAVDRVFYEQLLSGLVVNEATQTYREFLEAEIDFRNARNALRLARSGADIDPSEYFIEGGSLFRASQLNTLASNVDELVTVIRDSRYGDRLDAALDEFEQAESLISFEQALDAALLEYADRLGVVHPLSVAPVISYILKKEREVDNIRAIARGREAGLSEEEIEDELVIL